jgi:hypothetical protein
MEFKVRGLTSSSWIGCCALLTLLPFTGVTAGVSLEIGQNFTGSRAGIDSVFQPPDANGAVGPSHFVEIVNGRFSVYSKSNGQRVQTMTDMAFWRQSGVTFGTGIGVSDPRVIFDTYSQRWFASMVDASESASRQSRNRFLLAVSETDDPTRPWHAFGFIADPVNSDFADFPTLGLDKDAVYLSGDMFTRSGFSIGPSLVAIPKSSLLAAPPNVAGRTSFGVLAYNQRGNILQPAITTGNATTGESVLAVSSLGTDTRSHTTLFLSTVQDADTIPVLADSVPLTVPDYTAGDDPTQPDGSNNLDGGDSRFSACIRRVGDIIYAVHSVQVNDHSGVRCYRINATNSTVLDTTTIADPNLDLFYPSVAANESGMVVIGCNGSSASTFVSCYAVAGETIGGSLTFGDLTLLKTGQASYQSIDSTGSSRWGDYSATTVDPVDPTRFWTIQSYPADRRSWATQITELIIGEPRIKVTTTPSSSTVVLSWPASASAYQLEYTPELPPAGQWTPISDTPKIVGDRITLTVSATEAHGFYRLVQP